MPVTHRAPNFVFTEHEFELPLDHAQPGAPTIIVFLQGGPGSEAPRLLKLIEQ